MLIKGYARENKGVWFASSTTTLIKDSGKNILVDPGANRKLLLEALTKERLKPKDIDYVVITHTHLDHCLLIGIFENAKVIDDDSIYSFDSKSEDHDGRIPGTDVQIIKTPGHDQFHCAVVVKNTKLGTVAIVADVFWWRENQEQKTDTASLIAHKDPYVKNQKQLDASRKKVLEVADYIIPGHGGMFKVEK